MALNLYAPPHVLPLAWELRERLTGEKKEEPYRFDSPTGPVSTPGKIDAILGKFRGLVSVVVNILHKVAPSAPVNVPLVPVTVEFSLHAPSEPFALDASTLGTAFYRELKPYVDTYRNAEGGTPGEVYAIELHASDRAAEEEAELREPEPELFPELPPVREPRPKRVRPTIIETIVRYRDRVTGKYVSEEKWKRSRAAKRGAAKRTGKAAGAGRYVRHVEQRAR